MYSLADEVAGLPPIVPVQLRSASAPSVVPGQESSICTLSVVPGEASSTSDPSIVAVQASSNETCLLYTSPSPRDQRGSRMPSSA